MKLTNIHNVPDPIVDMVTHDEYSRGPARISVTQLIDAPQIRVLRERHEDDIVDDVSHRIQLLVGKAIHKYAETMVRRLNQTNEQRLFAKVEGWMLSGAIDVQQNADATIGIRDYKSTKVSTLGFDKPEWEGQLNAYAYLAETDGWELNQDDDLIPRRGVIVRDLEIWVILLDWSRGEAGRNREYPQSPIKVISIPLWDQVKRAAYVKYRMRLHQIAQQAAVFGEPLLPCTPEQQWRRNEGWAVVRPKGKRAVRVFEGENAESGAREYSAAKAGTKVEHRPGRAVRCATYCLVARWCKQRAAELISIGNEETNDADTRNVGTAGNSEAAGLSTDRGSPDGGGLCELLTESIESVTRRKTTADNAA
jgi:hypothetical protein